MSIKLTKVHIENYRSIQNLTISLENTMFLFGKNDSGKSNIIRAINLAFSNISINESDVYISKESPNAIEKTVIVDVLFTPVDDGGNRVGDFDDQWWQNIGTAINTDIDDTQYFAYRTKFYYSDEREDFIRERKFINSWDDEEIVEGNGVVGKLMYSLDFILLDAHRDIAADIADRYSRWNKELSHMKLPVATVEKVEESLGNLGEEIVVASDFLTSAQKNLVIATNEEGSDVKISPISRNVNELYKGLDIYIECIESTPLPVSSFGSGTRSRAVFATYKTLIDAKINGASEIPYYCLVAFEEPEAHVHPNSQKQLVSTFNNMGTQRIITTHSPSLLSLAGLNKLVYVSKKNTMTSCEKLEDLALGQEDRRRIERCILNTRGDILFSSSVILAEGETEEQALPIFFKEYFGKYPFELGVTIVGVGGRDYRPFLTMCKALGISWFIFSDGEAETIRKVTSQIKEVLGLDEDPNLEQFPNIVVLGSYKNFETYLIDEGYADEIIDAINSIEAQAEDVDLNPKMTFFEQYIYKHDGESLKPRNTKAKCEKCGQFIRERPVRDYGGEEGRLNALGDCMKAGKVKYAAAIAETIVESPDAERRMPQAIAQLFEEVGKDLGAS